MIDLFSKGRLIAGFPVGTSMDTCYSYGVNPSQLRPKYYEGIELILQGVDGHRAVRLQRRVQQAPLRQRGAAAVPAAAPAGLDPGRRLDRDVGLLRRERLRLRRPHLLRPQDGPRDRRRLLEPGRGPRQGLQPQPPGGHPVRRRRRHRRRGLPALQGAGRVLLQPLAARLPRLHRPARLRHRGVGAGPLQERRCAPSPAPSRPRTT